MHVAAAQRRASWMWAFMADPNAPGGGIPRRSFLKYAAIGGFAAWGAASAYAYPIGWRRWIEYGRKPWEVDLGVVDYDRVPDADGTMDAVPQYYLTGPPERKILNVAQWYDYWPGTVVRDFATYMEDKFGLSGCAIRWTSNIYTSNEELFTWISQTGRKFDVMVPTNYTVETMDKAGYLVNLNRAWLPNYDGMFGLLPSDAKIAEIESRIWRPEFYTWVPSYPRFPNGYNNHAGYDFRSPNANGYQYRMNAATYPDPRGTDYITWDEQNSLVAVPYQWGTTGIGYRSDVFARADIEDLGWEVFELTTYRNSVTGQTFDLTKKKMMLDDMREVFTAALKAVGWKRQEADGLTPSGVVGSNGQYQWSSNALPLDEVDAEKVTAAQDWLLSWRGGAWGFNTPQQGPWLVSKQMYVDQAWSGDIMYAVRPNSSQFLPVEYFVPNPGGARWIDNMVIHRESEKLWLAHQFINYIHDPLVQADISTWNLYASPNAWSFQLLHQDTSYSYTGLKPDGSPYYFNPAEDHRIYADFAIGYGDDPVAQPPILERCEYQKDVGVRNTLRYLSYWRAVKF